MLRRRRRIARAGRVVGAVGVCEEVGFGCWGAGVWRVGGAFRRKKRKREERPVGRGPGLLASLVGG